MAAEQSVSMQFVGLGSMFTVRFARPPIATPSDIPAASRELAQLFHLESLLRGVLVASRGDIFASLPAGDSARRALRDVVAQFIASHEHLIRTVVPS